MTKTLMGVWLAVLSGACSVVSPPESTSTTEQELLLPCDGSEVWTRYWYENGVEVGREDCDCPGILTTHGTLIGTFTQVVGPVCSGGGGGGGGGGSDGSGCFSAPTPSMDGASPNNAPPFCP